MESGSTAGTDEPGDGRWLDAASEYALRSIIPFHMAAPSAALYGRWWQLERYLRSLVYVELRALQGEKWVDAAKSANGRLSQDAIYTHLSGPDNENPMAYLDYSQLLGVIDGHWDQVGYALFHKNSWSGRQEELQRIRHRIGHVRRPHADDVNRLEQALRDLERGAFIAYASYNQRRRPEAGKHTDPVTRRWVAVDHRETRELLDHAQRKHGISLEVRTSRRPWASLDTQDLTAAPGRLWHADFFTSLHDVNVFRMWRALKQSPVESLLVQLEIDTAARIGFTFSAADDADRVADAIGHALRLVMGHMSIVPVRDSAGTFLGDHSALARRYRDMDYRVACDDGWTIVDDSTLPISNFGSGGNVTDLPHW